MLFGMNNSPATFLRFVNSLIAGMDGIGAYIDIVTIYNDFWEPFNNYLTYLQSTD